MHDYTDTIREVFDAGIRETDYGVVVSPYMFFLGSSDSVALFVSRLEDTRYAVNDVHSVTDYWDDADISIEEHKERIDKICKAFDLTFDGKYFCMESAGNSEGSLRHLVEKFIQAISLLGNIEV